MRDRRADQPECGITDPRHPRRLDRDILLILSGALVAIVKDVYGYEFGSSTRQWK